ncbi:cupin domain-containing protein [Streptomyces cadmiisoli]|uniref:Cupin domain-containing protein n=1 Tax=Streptomyces cadmiisoli TaxID=2184053 RepID=A0A2Z4JCN7_9ACTN|nr:cupin domain-containing protein [Streptomyces cadmiisoli]AWW42879.1 cupin domain-containing protein [Streptomyces cadmiisoli]
MSDENPELRLPPTVQILASVPGTTIPENAVAKTVLITLPGGDAGSPPHRHSGPAFGYVVKGEMIFELEGEPQRVIKAGETFWEPGADVIHYQGANNLPDGETAYLATILSAPGQPVLTVVSPEELEARRDRRAPRL